MGNGYLACYADVVGETFIKKTAPKEWKKFNGLFVKSDAEVRDIVDLFTGYEYEKTDDNDLLREAYDSLVKKFNEKTGLTLSINYHDSGNDGDRYDEVNEWFWEVGGVYDITPAGKKYGKYITRSTWVTFG